MTLEYPFFWVNFKIYPGTAGEEGLAIARTIERVAADTGVTFVVSPQLPDLRLLASETDLPLLAQAADAVEPGRGMGRVLPETVTAAGADALSINHAERRDTVDDVAAKIERCREVGLESILSAHGIEQARALASFDPDCLVFEVPGDIATDRAITQTHPERVREFVDTIEDVNPRTRAFVGGGISTGEDVALAFEQGADAVGAASAVVGAEDREAKLRDLASGFPE
jgi:triosephosphate isomerase